MCHFSTLHSLFTKDLLHFLNPPWVALFPHIPRHSASLSLPLSRFSLSSRVYSSSRPESYWRFRIPWIRGGSVVPSVSSLSQSRPKNKVPKPPEDKRNNPSYRSRKPTRGQLKWWEYVSACTLVHVRSRVLTGSVQHADASLGICAKLCIHLRGFAGDIVLDLNKSRSGILTYESWDRHYWEVFLSLSAMISVQLKV